MKNTAVDFPMLWSMTVRVTSTPTDARPKSSAPEAPDGLVLDAPGVGTLSFGVVPPVPAGMEEMGAGGEEEVEAPIPRVPDSTKRQRASGSFPDTGSDRSCPPSTWAGQNG